MPAVTEQEKLRLAGAGFDASYPATMVAMGVPRSIADQMRPVAKLMYLQGWSDCIRRVEQDRAATPNAQPMSHNGSTGLITS